MRSNRLSVHGLHQRPIGASSTFAVCTMPKLSLKLNAELDGCSVEEQWVLVVKTPRKSALHSR